MKDFNEIKKLILQDSDVAREYEEHAPEFEVARALIRARITSQMTQGEVAEKMHTSQSQVARLESGEHLPSLQSIHKYAQAVERKISIEIYPS